MNRIRSKYIVSMSDVLDSVCYVFDISPKDVFKDTKDNKNCKSRQFFFNLCYTHTKASLTDIGKFSKKYSRRKPYNYSTVLHAYVLINDQANIYKDTKEVVNKLTSSIQTKYLINNIKESNNENINKYTLLVNNFDLTQLTKIK